MKILGFWVQLRLYEVGKGVALTLLGAILSVAGVLACREAIRITRLDLASLLPHHTAAAQIDGFWLFAIFLFLNTLAIAACIRIVAKNLRPSP